MAVPRRTGIPVSVWMLATIDRPIGIIIAIVAASDTNIEIRPVTSMCAKNSTGTRVAMPRVLRNLNANRFARPCFSRAYPISTVPRIQKKIGWP